MQNLKGSSRYNISSIFYSSLLKPLRPSPITEVPVDVSIDFSRYWFGEGGDEGWEEEGDVYRDSIFVSAQPD